MGMISIGSGAAARGLPVFLPTTEALADANTAVWEMTGGASANETGVGGGLAGADLVLAQAGGIGAASSGYRAISSASMGFQPTAAAVAAMLGGAEWSIMLLLNTWTIEGSDNRYIMYLSATSVVNGEIYLSRRTPNTSGTMVSGISNGIFTGLVPHTTVPNATGDIWVAMWRKGGSCHTGWVAGSVAPTGWDSIPTTQRQLLIGAGNMAANDCGTYRYIVGLAGNSGITKVGRVVMSKLGLQAAPL